MPAPTITRVVYFDPWAPKPSIAGTAAGLLAAVSGAPSGVVLAARMIRDGEPWGVTTIGMRADQINIFPLGPLSPASAYQIQLQWIATGSKPPPWTDPTVIATAPVVSTTVRVTAGLFDGVNLALTWEGGTGPGAPPGAVAQVVDQNGTSRFVMTRPGGSGSLPLKPAPTSTYQLYMRGVEPLLPDTANQFNSPYSFGTVCPPLPLPVAGPVISAVTYDGAGLEVDWAPVPVLPGAILADVEYTLHVLVDGQVAATYPAGSTGGCAAVGEALAARPFAVAGRVRIGPLTGPLSAAPTPVLGTGPAIEKATAGTSSTTGNTTVEVAPSGSSQTTVDLLVDGAVVSSAAATGSPAVANFDLPLPAGACVQTVARLTVSGTVTSSGPPGPPVAVLADPSAIASASYDGARLSVVLQGDVPRGALSYFVALASGDDQLIVLTTPAAETLRADVELDLTTTWRMTVCPLGVRTSGLISALANVALPAVAAPVVRNVAYDGQTLEIEWDRASLPELTGYTVTLAGAAAGTYTTGLGTSFALPLPVSAAVGGTTVTVTGNSPTRSTAASGPATVPVPAPATEIASLAYDGANITVELASTPPTLVTVAVFAGTPEGKGDGVVPPTATKTATATIPAAPSKFTAGTTYVVALTFDPAEATTLWGPGATLVLDKPSIVSARFDGAGADVAWTVPAETDIAVVEASLYDSTAKAALVTKRSAGARARLVPAAALDPAHEYTVVATGVRGTARGPQVTLGANLILSSPAIQSATYAAAGSGWEVTVKPAPDPSPPGAAVARLLCDGRIAAEQPVSGDTAVIQRSAPLDPASSWAVDVFYRATASGVVVEGPPSTATAIPVLEPVVTVARFEKNSFHVEWEALAGDPGARLRVMHVGDGKAVAAETVDAGSTADFEPTVAIDPAEQYVLQVGPVLGLATGAFGPPLPLVVAPPAPTAVVCDGEQALVTVSPVSAPATATVVRLLRDGVPVVAAEGGPAGGFLPIGPEGPQSPPVPLTAAVLGTAGVVAGPPTPTPVPVILDIPALSGVRLGTAQIEGMATVTGSQLIEGLTVGVAAYRDGVMAGTPLWAAPGPFTLPAPPPLPGEWTLRAWLKGTADGATIEGPASPPVPVLTRPPRLGEVALSDSAGDGQHWRLTATWTVDQRAGGCDVTLTQGSETLLDLEQAQSPLDVPIPSDSGIAASATPVLLTVRPRGGFGTGPATVATLLTEPVAATAVAEADAVSAQWTAPTIDGGLIPTSYRLRLVRATQSGWSTVAHAQPGAAAATSMPLPAVIADDNEYGVAVDVGFWPAWSSSGHVTPLMRSAPEVVTVLGFPAEGTTPAKASVSWRWPGGSPPSAPAVTGYSVVLVDGDREETLTATSVRADGATVDIPAGAGAAARVGVRASAGAATGPRSETAALLLGKRPTLTAVTTTSRGLVVEFDASAAPAPNHVVTLYERGRPVAYARTASSRATLPFGAVVPSMPYSVDVAAVSEDGVSRGPGSDTATALFVAPTLSAPVAIAGGVRVTIVAPPPVAKPFSYSAELTLDGMVVGVASGLVPSDAGELTVPVGTGIDPAGSYAVRVYPHAGIARGPAATLPVLLAAPRLVSAAVRSDGGTLVVDVRLDSSRLAGTGLSFDAVLVTDKGTTDPAPVTGGQTTIQVPPGATTCAVSVRERTDAATGPWSTSVAVPLAAPVVSEVAWDGEAVTVLWSPVAGPPEVDRYRVVVDGASGQVARATVEGVAATIPVPRAARPVAVTIAALTPRSAGLASKPVAVPVAAPAVAKAVTDAQTGRTTVSWTAPPGPAPSGYGLVVYVDGQPSGDALTTTGTSQELPAVLAPGAEIDVAVSAKWQSGGAVLVGPFGPRYRVPTRLVALRDVDCDASSASAHWDPVPGATGYTLQVLASGLTAPVGRTRAAAGARFARFPADVTDATRTYTLVIQAEAGDSTGPPAKRPLFTPGLYLTTQLGPPVVLRAARLPVVAQPVNAYLADIGTLEGPLPIEPPQVGATGAPFSLAENPSTDPKEKAAFPYVLTIANGALLFDTARDNLASTYGALLKLAEEQKATARGIFAIQQAVARLMPQTLPETLFYSYGLSRDGAADLRPGTVLRVAFSEYDATATPHNSDWSTGYAGGAVVDYDLGDYFNRDGTWLVGFDAFISWLTANSVLRVQGPVPEPEPEPEPVSPTGADVSESGAAEAADLAYPTFQKPFHRLFFPQNLQQATPPAVGRTGQQFAIAAAAKWKDIDAAGPRPTGNVSVAYFRGRTVVKLCVRITVDGTERVVPVGTTVGNLLDQSADRAPSAPVALRGLLVERAVGGAVLDPAAPYAVGRRERLRLDWNGLVRWTGGDALSLPVLHGDRITLGGE